MEGERLCCGLKEKWKPYIAMICLQFGYAGMNIITKVSLDRGMSHYVLVVYRNAYATASIAPFALVLERKERPKITFPIFMQMFLLGLLGPVIDQNLYYAGLKLTSPTFSCAMTSMLPAMTFVMAVLCRMEKVDIRKIKGQAKVVGTIVTVAGTMLMTLYKGHVVTMIWTQLIHPSANPATRNTPTFSDKDWIKGSILLILASLVWATFFILQAMTMSKYRAHLSLATIVCGLGTLQSMAVTLVVEHKPSVWLIGMNLNLLSAAYAGIVSSSIAYYVQGTVMQRRGPVFVSTFSSLIVIIVAIIGSFILVEKIYVGGVLGAVLIVIGLYAVLWGKHKEIKEEAEEIPQVTKGDNHSMPLIIIESIQVNSCVKTGRTEANKVVLTAVATSAAIRQPPVMAVETPEVESSSIVT